MIKVGIVSDQFGNLQRGGAEIQVENTVRALNETGKVDAIYIDRETRDLAQFDLVHFFKSSAEYYGLANLLSKKGIPYVVSTIIFPLHYWKTVWKFRAMRFLPQALRRITLPGMVQDLWMHASALYPNTDEEALFLRRSLQKYAPEMEVVLNGIDFSEFDSLDNGSSDFYNKFPFLKGQDFVLNVGRIEYRKNQKNLILACRKLGLPVVIIGKVGDEAYYKSLQSIGYEKCYFLGPIYDRSILFGAYRACSVFCLPSTLETPGIAALEAAYFNKPIVITKYGGTTQYFGDKVHYVDWRNVDEIVSSIKESFDAEVNYTSLIEKLSWANIADRYVSSYNSIVGRL